MEKFQLNCANLGFYLGTKAKYEESQTLPLHRAYVKADDAGRMVMFNDFAIGLISGYLGIAHKSAEKVRHMSRTERTDEQNKAYRKAVSDFGYHISRVKRDESGSAKTDPTIRVIGQALKGANKAQMRRVLDLLESMGLIELE